jgi:hypothetical protein
MTVNSGDVLRVTAKMEALGGVIQNVYYIQAQGTGDVSDEDTVEAIGNRLDAAYGELEAVLTSDLTFRTIEVFNITQDVPVDEFQWPTLDAGGSATDPLPTQIAALVRFTNAAARSQGRKYIGGLTKAATDEDGLPTTAVLTVLGAFAAALLDPWLVGVGEFAFGAWNKDKGRFAEFLSPILNTVWSALGRRRFGQGS